MMVSSSCLLPLHKAHPITSPLQNLLASDFIPLNNYETEFTLMAAVKIWSPVASWLLTGCCPGSVLTNQESPFHHCSWFRLYNAEPSAAICRVLDIPTPICHCGVLCKYRHLWRHSYPPWDLWNLFLWKENDFSWSGHVVKIPFFFVFGCHSFGVHFCDIMSSPKCQGHGMIKTRTPLPQQVSCLTS